MKCVKCTNTFSQPFIRLTSNFEGLWVTYGLKTCPNFTNFWLNEFEVQTKTIRKLNIYAFYVLKTSWVSSWHFSSSIQLLHLNANSWNFDMLSTLSVPTNLQNLNSIWPLVKLNCYSNFKISLIYVCFRSLSAKQVVREMSENYL